MSEAEIILSRIKEVKTHGFGQVTVKVHDGKIAQIETMKVERPK